jgi:phosphatidylserine decarboxylase
MSQPSHARPGALSRTPATTRLTERAVAALTTEFTRHGGPKTGLVLDAHVGSPVLTTIIEALLPDDRVTVVAGSDAGGLRAHVTDRGAWVAERVRVVEALAEADAADVVIVAEPLTGTAEATRARLDDIAKHLTEGAVLTVATLATPGLADGASAELGRQSSFYGVGSDLVVRNRPPLRIHRLRFAAAPVALAGRLRPAIRPSSVPLTRSMNIDSNGVAAAGIALGLAAAAKATRRDSKLWMMPALLAAPIAAFFRDPERAIPEDEAAIVAASDGTVLSVERFVDTRLGDEEFLRVAVFLSVLDVHVNRAPVAGRVVDYFVEDGGYAAAMKPEAEHNVAAYTVLETAHGTVVVAQRTGLIARRIVHRVPVGSLLAKSVAVHLLDCRHAAFRPWHDTFLSYAPVLRQVAVLEQNERQEDRGGNVRGVLRPPGQPRQPVADPMGDR